MKLIIATLAATLALGSLAYAGNTAVISQSGYANSAFTGQVGRNNTSVTFQSGHYNGATTFQHGRNNAAGISQMGGFNGAQVFQGGGMP